MLLITYLREKKGWTKFELGSKARVHPANLGKYESGRWIPYPVELQRLAEVLEFSGEPEELLKEVE